MARPQLTLTMLENARRQTILVFLTLAAGLLCTFLVTPGWGMDLEGGSQLIYEVPEDQLQKLVNNQAGTTVEAIMSHTEQIVRDRIDPTGTLDAFVSRRGRNGILIELPWREKSEVDQIKSRITSLGRLEMRVVATDHYVEGGVTFDLQKEQQRLRDWLAKGGKGLVAEDWRNIERFNDDPNGPLAYPHLRWVPHLVEPQKDNTAAWDMPFSESTQSADGVTPLGGSSVPAFDRNTEYNSGMLSPAQQQQKRPTLLEFVAINMHEVSFRGEDLAPDGVSAGVSQDGGLAVNYRLREELHGAYGDWSKKYTKKHSAIILNGVVRSAPYFRGRIPGNGQISGGFTRGEVDDLVKVLRTGALQVEPQQISDRGVGPTLGQKALDSGKVSLIAGTIAVFAFMLWYYKLAGIVACVTLLLNVFLLWTSLLFMQATITLPGLGGMVLTMGMAVDANVLIYERIREEADRGKDMLRAVRAGFERAMSAILDANITTFLVGIVLYNVGVGPVRGFAVTLMVGIVTTVFTQFFVTRLLFHYLLESKKLETFKVRRLLAQPNFDYLKRARACVTASVIAVAAGLVYGVAIVPTEVSYGIDFKGGANLQVVLQQPTEATFVRQRLADDTAFNADFRNFQVNTIEGDDSGKSDTFNVRVKLTDAMRDTIEQDRTAARLARAKAEADNADTPPPYEPPYVAHLRRIFAGELIKPAFSNAGREDGPDNDAYVSVDLHLQAPVELAKVQQLLAKKMLSNARVSVAGDEAATQGKDLVVEWTTGKATRASTLAATLRGYLEGTKPEDRVTDVNGQPLRLSEPFPEAEEIQGRMVGELRNAAIGALILSWVLIIFYLRVRFHEYKYGIAAVVALVHDVAVTFGVVILANSLGIVHAEINLNMIACFLTIIGYSVNDTIVIFDRIRENLREDEKLGGHLTLRQVINLSVNQTMSRTILTSGVTAFVVLAQLVVNWGTDSDLESFAFGMLVGMISGTYSTIFIAGPVLTWIADREAKNAPPRTRAATVAAPAAAP